MKHTPVLLKESIEGLDIKPDGIYIDGTLGRGGHTIEIAKRLQSGRIIAIDRDADALKESSEVLIEYKGCISFVHGNFRDITRILDEKRIDAVDGMIFDLGVSSPQLDDHRRGFSYMSDAPLDMRMDRLEDLTAFEAINTWSEEKLRCIFYEYGEERYATLIARAIVRKRAASPIESTQGLCEVIITAIPAAARHEEQHPAKRCFLAIRIAINDELDSLREMLGAVPERLKIGGRICVISFHSLEDRIVKKSFAAHAIGCTCPKDFPMCVCGITPTLRQITKKPIIPGNEEIENNSRARSAKLRIAERIGK